jgi:hypothetical protein
LGNGNFASGVDLTFGDSMPASTLHLEIISGNQKIRLYENQKICILSAIPTRQEGRTRRHGR